MFPGWIYFSPAILLYETLDPVRVGSCLPSSMGYFVMIWPATNCSTFFLALSSCSLLHRRSFDFSLAIWGESSLSSHGFRGRVCRAEFFGTRRVELTFSSASRVAYILSRISLVKHSKIQRERHTMLSMERPNPAKMERDRSIPRMSERRGGPLGCSPSMFGSCQPNPTSMGIWSRSSWWASNGCCWRGCACGRTSCAETTWVSRTSAKPGYAETSRIIIVESETKDVFPSDRSIRSIGVGWILGCQEWLQSKYGMT